MKNNKKQTIAESLLNEVNMSPSRLRQLVANIPGAKAGMEFEMLVPDVVMGERPDQDDYDDFESEPDYSMDEDTVDIDNICKFFKDDNHNSSSDIASLRDELTVAYNNWLKKQIDTDQIYEDWQDEGEEYIRDYLISEEGMTERDATKTAEEIWNRKRDWRYTKINNLYVDDWINKPESDWLEAGGYDKMSDIARDFNIMWPHWTEPDDDYISRRSNNDDDLYIDDLAEEFSDVIGKKVNWSLKYHEAQRTKRGYALEPDSSLKGGYEYEGLEFISHPMPIPEMISDLKKVITWANEKGCETNDSTGLHMNVSMPNQGNDNFDYVKMALFFGDNHVAEQFGRYGNTFCMSAIDKINYKAQNATYAEKAMLYLKQQLNHAASKIIHENVTDKYTSINIKNDASYVEVRSPGGDWLNADIDLLVNTLNRIVVALDAACDPEKYKQEYLTKLYKLLAPSGDSSIDLFVKFSNGVISSSTLKSKWLALHPDKQFPSITNAPKYEEGKIYLHTVTHTPSGQTTEVQSNSAIGAKLKGRKSMNLSHMPLEQFSVERIKEIE